MIQANAQLGPYAPEVAAALADLQARDAIGRLWSKDATLWKSDADHKKIIANALGWLDVIAEVRAHADDLASFATEVADAGFRHVLLMGMGGSSLCPEVFRRTHDPIPGHPELLVLDSTVPATIQRLEGQIDPARTLFVVASKSGKTIEPSVFLAYFFGVVKKLKGDRAGANFVAITDPGTPMEAKAKADGFRRIVRNMPDIGGRYSALSYFGMVPAALMGLDLRTLLDRASALAERCKPETPIDRNPGARLGAALGTLALKGRDKVTIHGQSPLEALGLWIEQLIAESTGKEGKGILPVANEPLGPPEVYGPDRLFVRIRVQGTSDPEADRRLKALADAGHPVIEHELEDTTDLGAEFFQWEIATALAGQRLGIDPFDQPNVQESKDNTNALLQEFARQGRLTEPEALASSDGLTLSADPGNRDAVLGPAPAGDGRERVIAALRAHFARVRPGDYVAITQYIDELPERDVLLQSMRSHIRDTLKVATTTGYGPRFLHSTGQLHKGGSDAGVFLQITADDGADLPIPGEPFGFATLVKAQALGDYQSLATRHRRALRVHLGSDVDRGLATLAGWIEEAVRPR